MGHRLGRMRRPLLGDKPRQRPTWTAGGCITTMACGGRPTLADILWGSQMWLAVWGHWATAWGLSLGLCPDGR